jgi:hypothetical protein
VRLRTAERNVFCFSFGGRCGRATLEAPIAKIERQVRKSCMLEIAFYPEPLTPVLRIVTELETIAPD